MWFDVPNTVRGLKFCGFVTGLEVNGKVIVCPYKIFKKAFGYDLPAYTKMTIG